MLKSSKKRIDRGPKVELERVLVAWCIHESKKRGWVTRKMSGLGFRSWPDRLFIPSKKKLKLRSFWVEFKRQGKSPTPAQNIMHEELRARGETVYVIDNRSSFMQVIIKENHE